MEPLWQWAERIAQRRGKKIATIALAHRLGGTLWAMWRDGSVYQRQEAASNLLWAKVDWVAGAVTP